MEKPHNVVEIKNLKVELMSAEGLVTAVRGADLTVKKGEVHGIVGESGCGKSVMMKSVMRLHDEKKTLYHGSILVDGKEVLKMKEKELLAMRGKEVAMIFQNPMTSLSPIMKVGQQIQEAILVKDKQVSKEEARNQALQIMSEVGITPAESRYHMYPFELSGGLLQRVMIAMAMVNDPDILIADEPTTALDVTIQAQILALMKKMQKETGVSIIFITHDLGVVAEMCDSVSVMYAGKIVESGSIYDIFDHPGHPYTKALLESMPKGSDQAPRLTTIPGKPPALNEEIIGCSFAPRCPYATDRCRKEGPVETALAEGHTASCHYTEELFTTGEIHHG